LLIVATWREKKSGIVLVRRWRKKKK